MASFEDSTPVPWLSVTATCSVTARSVEVPIGRLELATGPNFVNWLVFDCPACGQKHRFTEYLINVSH